MLNEPKMSDSERAGRVAYAVFCDEYRRIHGAELPRYEQLGSASSQVWNATAVRLAAEIPPSVSPPERV